MIAPGGVVAAAVAFEQGRQALGLAHFAAWARGDAECPITLVIERSEGRVEVYYTLPAEEP